MLKRNAWAKITVTVFVLAALVGLAAVVNSAAGSNSDPLVTLSYVNGTYKTQLLSEVESAVQKGQSELASTLASQITSFKSARSKKAETPVSNPYKSVSLTDGSSYQVPAGAQLLVLSGRALVGVSCLTDTTAGEVVPDQGQLKEYHLYISSAECSIVASGDMKFLIRP